MDPWEWLARLYFFYKRVMSAPWRLWCKARGLRRFWVEFRPETPEGLPDWGWMGCGVTAYDRDDALQLLRRRYFKASPMPAVAVTEDVEISSLDQNHVVCNAGNYWRRGIWFP